MKIAIVDDETEYLFLIEKIIKKINSSYEIYTYNNGYDFLKKSQTFDVVFLDIDMPSIDGFEISKMLNDSSINISYITSHNERMIEAFNKNVIGFILKENLEIGIKDIFEKIDKKRPLLNINHGYYKAKIYMDEIVYIHYCLRDITFHLLNQENIIVKEVNLKDFLFQLNDSFVLINRTTVVNIRYVIDFKSGYVFLNDCKLKVSRRNLKKVEIKLFERKLAYGRLE